MDNSIGEKIYQRRKELKLTQRELAERLDVSDKTVSRWELGTTVPDTMQIPMIAAALDLNVNDLFDVEESKERVEANIKEKDKNDPVYFRIAMIFACSFLLISALFMAAGIYFLDYRQVFFIISLVILILAVGITAGSETGFIHFYTGRYVQTEYRILDYRLFLIFISAFCFLFGVISGPLSYEVFDNPAAGYLAFGLEMLEAVLSFFLFRIKKVTPAIRKGAVILWVLSFTLMVLGLVLNSLNHPIEWIISGFICALSVLLESIGFYISI